MSNAIFDANTFQSAYGQERGQTGLLAPQVDNTGQAALLLVAKRAYAARFVPSRDMTITKIAYVVSVAATNNDSVDVGIYNAALTTRLVSSGETAGQLNGLGVRTITVTSTPLTAGTVYYAALVCGAVGGTAASVAGTSFIAAGFGNIFGSTAGIAITASQEAVFPLGSSFTSGGGQASIPILAVRES